MSLKEKVAQKTGPAYRAKQIWDGLDQWKTIIGLSLLFLHDHLFPDGTWYSDLIEIIALVFVTVGGAHKFIKARYGK